MQRERIRWACRRGMLECDLFLVPFFEKCYDGLSDNEKAIFHELLEESDAHIYAWLMQSEQPNNSAYVPILDKIRHFKSSAVKS